MPLWANVDLETASTVDLTAVGAYVYAEHPTTHILCMAYKISGGHTQLWWPGMPFPSDLAEVIILGGEIHAWNASFERTMWPLLEARHGAPAIDLSQWRCTMVRALLQGFPAALQHAGPSMGLGVCKDDAGHRLMLQLCKPRQRWQPGKKGYDSAIINSFGKGSEYQQLPDGELVRWWRDGEKLERLGAYCVTDVDTEAAAGAFLDPIPEHELRGWQLDQRINDRGFYVDTELVHAALALVKPATDRANVMLAELTGGALKSVTQPNLIRAWLNEQLGLELTSIDKDTLNDLLVTMDEQLPPNVKKVIKLRLAAAKTSTAKLRSLLKGLSADDRFRGGLQYAGAGRTNRWCLAEGTEVLCKKALTGEVLWLRIEDVTPEYLVHDGEGWVPHDGVVSNGEREVMTYAGLTATPQHIVWTSPHEKMTLAEAESRGLPIWKPDTSSAEMRAIQAKERELKNEGPRMRTYDILNAGPNNRFVTRAGVVSNSGRRFQPQNLPRPEKWALEAVAEVLSRDLGATELMYGSGLEAISNILRSCIIAEPGSELRFADYNAIEARVAAWLCGAVRLLDAFATGKDPYRMMAAKVFGIGDWQDIGKDSFERFLGKSIILGCFGADTLVLTQRGWVPIIELCGTDSVWDGEEWVCHQGVVYRGLRKTLKLCGVCVTPDHLVWSGTQWLEAGSLAQDADTLSRALEHAAGNLPSPDTYAGPVVGSPRSSSSATAAGLSTRSTLTTSRTSNQHGATHAPSKHRPGSDSGSMPRPCPTTTTALVSLTGSRPPYPGATAPSASRINTTGGGGFASTPIGLRTEAHFCGMSRLSTDGTTQVGRSTGSIPTRGMSQATSDSQHAAKTCRTEEKSMTCSGKLPVYDVSYAGPRNRYTIWTDSGPLLVHNCGFGMGHPKFRETCRKQGQYITAELAERSILTYREDNWEIPAGWRDLERAAVVAMQNPGQWFEALGGKVHFWFDGEVYLRVRLPSGRLLSYLYPRLEEDETPWGKPCWRFKFWGWNGERQRMEWQDMYGGRWMENIVQATARDVMLDSMLRLEALGWKLILTVHDEIGTEAPKGERQLDEFIKVMSQPPTWAPDLPLAVEGWTGQRYRK